ncbi:MAG: hypothetical protein M5R36_28560 [Deltaproteobacteria bacterium]|nr:hypothetical protein [Deltaproteobacteria bacterium]
MADLRRADEVFQRRESDADHELALHPFLEAHDEIHRLVVRSVLGRNGDFVEVAGAHQFLFALANPRAGIEIALGNSEFAPDHLIARLRVAFEHDLFEVREFSFVDLEENIDHAPLGVRGRIRRHFGERVADVRVFSSQFVRGDFEFLAREKIARLKRHQLHEGFFFEQEVARDIDFADVILLAFLDIDGHEHRPAIGRERHDGLADLHFHVPVVEIVRTQDLNVVQKQFGPVDARAGHERPEMPFLGLEQLLEFVVLERAVADQVDPLDVDLPVFGDLDDHAHAVRRQRLGAVVDIDHEKAVVLVKLADLEDRFLDFRVGEDRVRLEIRAFLDLVVVDLFVADEDEFLDGGFFLDTVDQFHAAGDVARLDAHVVEIPHAVNVVDVAVDGDRVEAVADARLHLVEHRVRLDAQRAFHRHLNDGGRPLLRGGRHGEPAAPR